MSFILVRVTISNGKTTLSNLNGKVRSLNPGIHYNWQERPADASGPFEECEINGGIVAYNPLGNEPILFRFCQSVPGGFSALDDERLT